MLFAVKMTIVIIFLLSFLYVPGATGEKNDISAATETPSESSRINDDEDTSESTTHVSKESTSVPEQTVKPDTSAATEIPSQSSSITDEGETVKVITHVPQESTSMTERLTTPDTSTASEKPPEPSQVKDDKETSELTTYIPKESTSVTEPANMPDTSTSTDTTSESFSVTAEEETSEVITDVSQDSTLMSERTTKPATSIAMKTPSESSPVNDDEITSKFTAYIPKESTSVTEPSNMPATDTTSESFSVTAEEETSKVITHVSQDSTLMSERTTMSATSIAMKTPSESSPVNDDEITSKFTAYIPKESTSVTEPANMPDTSTATDTTSKSFSVTAEEETSEVITHVSQDSTLMSERTTMPDTSTATETPSESSPVNDDEGTSEFTAYIPKESTPMTEPTNIPNTSTDMETSFETSSVNKYDETSEITTYSSLESTTVTEPTDIPETTVTTGQSKKTTLEPSGVTDADNESRNACDDLNLCQNGGTCERTEEMGNKCHCMMGFSGKNCETIQWCQENKGVCGIIPCQYSENTGSGFCFCEDGLYFDAKTKMCKALDKCLFQRIKGNCSGDHETCDRMGNCICEENYAYNDDRTACEPDFCWKKSNKSRCGMNMECIEEDVTFSCSCKEGYRQIDEKCVKVDRCAPGIINCQQACTDGKCSCFTGFNKNEDGERCDRITSDSECNLECGKGSCVKEGTNEKCICPQISHVFKEKTCIDKCQAIMLTDGECPEEVGCVSDEDFGYKCNCTGKYDFAEDGVHCKAKRMCSEGYGNEECSLRGGLCEDNFALIKGFKCKCKFGYKENPETLVCEHMCETADCDKTQALCIINVDNKAECICPPLLVKDTDGRCSQLAKYSYLGNFLVPRNKYQVVAARYHGRTKRDTLEEISYAKLMKDFEDSMNNIFDGYEGTTVLNCTDAGDDWKCFLEMKLNKDPKEKIKIVSTPSTCLPLSDEYHCLIPPDFITRKRTANDTDVFQKTNPCDKSVIGKLCGDETECTISEPSGFKCECKQGYFRRTSFVPAENVLVDVCEDIDECLNPTICPNTTKCHNLPGEYTCKCIDGYHLEDLKSVKTDGCRPVCNPNPCVHGTCLETGTDGFACRCEGLYIGRFCNQTNDAITGIKKKGNKTAAIVGGILGAFLVVAIIICIILFRRGNLANDSQETTTLNSKRTSKDPLTKIKSTMIGIQSTQ
ncbi:unnamed protein product [Larinioides sclopetarius]|uniref:EGF-like domain-containing protein n=1 Tax=Larinioides sclopetarius TaxID=280406 RepID=A0AAV2BZV3_9ARAC